MFPAAILQPPFFNQSYPSWNIFGGIGAVIGHEVTHGFDDQGSQFDAKGNLSNWWSANVRQEFTNRAKCVVDLYDSYQPLPGLHINGRLTEGENLAGKFHNWMLFPVDWHFIRLRYCFLLPLLQRTEWWKGGLRLAHKAYQQSQDSVTDAEMQKYFPGLTRDQLFFISYGQLWCTVATGSVFMKHISWNLNQTTT